MDTSECLHTLIRLRESWRDMPPADVDATIGTLVESMRKIDDNSRSVLVPVGTDDHARASLLDANRARACAAVLADRGYTVYDACEMCVYKAISDNRYVLLSGYGFGEGDEPTVPRDLDAPAFFTVWDSETDRGGDDHPHDSLREALFAIEALDRDGAPPAVDVAPPGVHRGT